MSAANTAVVAHEAQGRPKPRVSILAKMADRFSVEPNNLLETLKATAFKSEKGVSNEQMISLLIVADQYSLNPFTKEIFAFPDKGGIVPVVGVDGWSRIINEHPQFDGVQFTYEGAGADLSCTCTIHRKDRAHPIAVTEYLAECKRGTGPWGSHPRRMLRHKALIQAARLAFGFAGIYDEDEAHRMREMGDAEVVQKPGSSIAAVREQIAGKAGASAVVVDAATGEVHSAPSRAPAAPAAAAPARAGGPQPATLAHYRELVDNALDGEAAALALDEARDVLDATDHATLTEHWRERWQSN